MKILGGRFLSPIFLYLCTEPKPCGMEYGKLLKKFGKGGVSDEYIQQTLLQVKSQVVKNLNEKVYKTCFACTDLTSLGSADSHDKIESFALKAVDLRKHFPDMPNVASICVYPVFVETVGLVVGSSNMSITSVAGGFPSSQTFLEVKMLEAAMAVENGADEIDVVISIGELFAGEYDLMGNELAMLRDEIGEDTVFKVIIESGLLAKPHLIREASLIAMAAGADFIKTSTGKTEVSATPEAVIVMCAAIKDYYEATGRKVGIKVAGGISSVEDAVLYYSIAEHILGSEWLSPELFRIGASSLADNLLRAIKKSDLRYFG